MEQAIVHSQGQVEGQQLADFSDLVDRAKDYLSRGEVANTKRAYDGDMKRFREWCEASGVQSLPAAPETVFLYLTHRADSCKVSTLVRMLASISVAHKGAGFPTPTSDGRIQELLASIKRVKGTAPIKKAAATVDRLKPMVAAQREDLKGKRNRAILLVGFAGAFRRSELVALDFADLEFRPGEGVLITLRRSKTDQEGKGETKEIDYGAQESTCPVKALRIWLDAAGITSGPVFRSFDIHGCLQPRRLTAQSVALVVKAAAKEAKLDPSLFSGHSLRSGFCTTAGGKGMLSRTIRKQTGHKGDAMVERYIEEGSRFQENFSRMAGL